ERNLSKGSSLAARGSAKQENKSRKLIIQNLYVRNGQVDISHPLLKKQLTAPLPPIHLVNIGRGSGGATPAQVADQLLGSIAANAGQVASSSLARNLGGNAVNNITKGAGGIGSRIQGLFK
ncbi:MAG: hypothetical protein KGI29_09440, partial [Pseudomonadota bacterium]|nr:hypothetical protein [Pseudomonadota bacterium]